MSDDTQERLRELEKQLAVLTALVENQNKEITSLKGGISRGLWIIGGGFLTSLITWIATGGLAK